MNEKNIREKYTKITKTLIKKKLTISTMESCSAGQIASLLTDTEGSSAIMKGAFITYCNEAKVMQGVSGEIIEKYGVYSKETAEAMAKACADAYGADIGIGITGTFGNIDENNSDSCPGKVYFAISFSGDICSYKIDIPAQKSRFEYKLAAADSVADKLIGLLPA